MVTALKTEGQFGPLYQCTNGRQQFVLKVIDKKNIEEYDVLRFAIDEGKTFEVVSCPFISSMGKKFQSPNYLYYLFEHIRGKDFYDILKSIGLLST